MHRNINGNVDGNDDGPFFSLTAQVGGMSILGCPKAGCLPSFWARVGPTAAPRLVSAKLAEVQQEQQQFLRIIR